jgi:hypothetical protein
MYVGIYVYMYVCTCREVVSTSGELVQSAQRQVGVGAVQ